MRLVTQLRTNRTWYINWIYKVIIRLWGLLFTMRQAFLEDSYCILYIWIPGQHTVKVWSPVKYWPLRSLQPAQIRSQWQRTGNCYVRCAMLVAWGRTHNLVSCVLNLMSSQWALAVKTLLFVGWFYFNRSWARPCKLHQNTFYYYYRFSV